MHQHLMCEQPSVDMQLMGHIKHVAIIQASDNTGHWTGLMNYCPLPELKAQSINQACSRSWVSPPAGSGPCPQPAWRKLPVQLPQPLPAGPPGTHWQKPAGKQVQIQANL